MSAIVRSCWFFVVTGLYCWLLIACPSVIFAFPPGNDPTALKAKFNKAAQEGRKEEAGKWAYQVAFLSQQAGDHPMATLYYQEAVKYFKETNQPFWLAKANEGLGEVYYLTNKADDAFKSYNTALDLYRNLSDKSAFARALLRKTVLFTVTQRHTNAVQPLRQAIQLALESGDDSAAAHAYKQLAMVYERMGKKQEAAECQRLYSERLEAFAQQETNAIDALKKELSAENQRNAQQMAAANSAIRAREEEVKRMEAEKKAADAIRLQQEQQLQVLNQESKLREALLKQQESDLRFDRLLIYGAVAIVLFVGIAGLLVWRESTEKQQANQELARRNYEVLAQKQELERKNKEITDSLRYAEQIQSALLPAESTIGAFATDAFILYAPKDIVSGDFYWFGEFNDFALLAVADCTGHGVPGAFMSMIGNTLFHEIVSKKQVFQPSQVLEQMNKGIQTALKQHEKSNDDGMDVCLCYIHKRSAGQRRVIFSGAKRPLYVHTGGQMHEYKGDKKHIGGIHTQRTDRQFTDTELDLYEGDMLYLTTDGYADQANPEGRKFGSGRLKELLAKLSVETCFRQKVELQVELDQHRQHAPQRDDITLLGVRL